MSLPVPPPVLPMLSKRIDALPEGEGWIFEPKWDGFRALVFRDGDDLTIQSRDGKPLNRYFPELVAALDFEMLQQRIHPAASRVKLLAEQIPVSIVFFDLLCDGERDLRAAPF